MHLAVCSFLERPADDTVFAEGLLPLHVTVLGNFRIDAHQSEVVDLVRGAARTLPIEVRLGGDEVFGSNREVHVTLTEPSVALNDLHRVLLEQTRRIGGTLVSPEFGGDGFRAHLTWPGNVRPAVAADLKLETLSIVDLEPEGNVHLRRITATV